MMKTLILASMTAITAGAISNFNAETYLKTYDDDGGGVLCTLDLSAMLTCFGQDHGMIKALQNGKVIAFDDFGIYANPSNPAEILVSNIDTGGLIEVQYMDAADIGMSSHDIQFVKDMVDCKMRPCNDGDGEIDELVPSLNAKSRGRGRIHGWRGKIVIHTAIGRDAMELGRNNRLGDRWMPPTDHGSRPLSPVVAHC